MQRRQFLTGLGALFGGVLLNEAVPFNRVWSFPKDIKIIRDPLAIYERDANGICVATNWLYTPDEVNALTMKYFVPVLHDEVFKNTPLFTRLRFPKGVSLNRWNGGELS